jgi:hypothetical protein
MGGRFTGWPEQAFEVLLQLDGEPSMGQRERLRKERERLVRQPMIALFNDVADREPAYEDFAVWGYGKMVWWWQHQVGIVRMPQGHEMSLRFDLDGLRISGGLAYRRLDAYRRAVAEESSGEELIHILADLRTREFEISGQMMKRGPRGYAADHPRADLLRHRTLIAGRQLLDEHGPEVFDLVLETFGDLRPLMAWLAVHA